MEQVKVFQGTITPDNIASSSIFTYGLFGYVKVSDVFDIKYDFGMALNVQLDSGSTIEDKEIPIALEEKNVADTFQTFRIPVEYSWHGSDCFLTFNSEIVIPNIEIFIIRSEETLESISEQIEALQFQVSQQQIQDTVVDGVLIANQIAQNLNLGAINLALAPITAGATAINLPALAQSTAALAATRLLLGGS